LLDAELLAEVYLAMTRGQNSLTIDLAAPTEATGIQIVEEVAIAEVIVLEADADELGEHEATLAGLDKEVKGQCLWHQA
jgi:DNA polymerase-3 subunit epsilon